METLLKKHRKFDGIFNRSYYKSCTGAVFCEDVDGAWFICSRSDGEPEAPIRILSLDEEDNRLSIIYEEM